jgi:hypothetical protein
MQKRNSLIVRTCAPGAVFSAVLFFTNSALAAIATPATPVDPAQRAIEEIEVIGQRSLLSWRFQMYSAEDRMYEMFNTLNSSDELDVECEQRQLTGSHMAFRFCNRRYMEDAQAENAIDAFRGYAFPKGPMQLWAENARTHEKFDADVKRLVAEHPEFAAAIKEMAAARERYFAERRHVRENTFLGRLLTGNQD